ncbi:lactoylglutathione lyase [Pseudomonas sp. ABC1]|uniref:lactoylglutathione lyase n=1 Tax=Pseudomonas sp. ABC1 TaxID=2748080 RepID=UPI0015C360C3|nr:lactoylglutathione lyase [Pseudomonas sp. ABC1]QLF92673.1 lactoylglutathione lyase [Pseudomonas sp. ABC1]
MTFTTEIQAGVCATPDAATQDYVFNHSMLRVKDPERSLDFYTRVMGMRLLRRLDFEEGRFSLYFLATTKGETVPEDVGERQVYTFGRQSVLELTHNWGTEDDDSVYHNGNSEPRGFGHICFAVPDIRAACARFEALGVNFVKRLDTGKMKDVAFISDPDNYWIELVQPDLSGELGR